MDELESEAIEIIPPQVVITDPILADYLSNLKIKIDAQQKDLVALNEKIKDINTRLSNGGL